MTMERFVVPPSEGAWWVSFADKTQLSFETLRDAERCAFAAAEASAAEGRPVTVLIVPTPEGFLPPLGGNDNHGSAPS